jgi:hypothetical protein
VYQLHLFAEQRSRAHLDLCLRELKVGSGGRGDIASDRYGAARNLRTSHKDNLDPFVLQRAQPRTEAVLNRGLKLVKGLAHGGISSMAESG